SMKPMSGFSSPMSNTVLSSTWPPSKVKHSHMSKHFRVPGRLSAKLRESGIRVSAVLQHAGLPPGLLDQPRILVSTEELFALWRGISYVSLDPAIGLQLGSESKPEHFDPIALAALSTGSFGEAMHQVARY